MSKPKRQHFIPKSYLRNFSIEKEGKHFVEAKLRSEDKPRSELISIKDICVDKNIYTLPNIDNDEKYLIEKYYAEHVDGVYPEVYALLVNPSINNITPGQRAQILMTTMSLFFRTPKFLNLNSRRMNLILEYAVKNHMDSQGNVKFKFKNYDLDFNIEDIDDVCADLKIKNKQKFLVEHLKDWHRFIEYKSSVGISVFRIYEDIDLISSDNPVIMHSIKGNPFDVFDPTNIINLPLDNKHFLTIFPNTESASTDKIFRGDRDKWFALSTNLSVEENSEDWILGKPKSIYAHISDQVEYGKHSPENLQALEDMKEKAQDGQELMRIIEEVGTIAHIRVANKVKELRKKRIYKDDPEMKRIIIDLAKLGFLTV